MKLEPYSLDSAVDINQIFIAHVTEIDIMSLDRYSKLKYTVRHLSGYLHLVRDLCSTECLCFLQCSCNAAFPLHTQIRKTTPPNVGIRGGGGLCTESCNQYPLPSYPMSHAHSRHFQFPAPFSRFPGRFTILPSAYFPHPSRQKKKKSFGRNSLPLRGC